MSSRSKEPRIEHAENPAKEIWSRLSYFESLHNAQQFLKGKFSLPDKDLGDVAKSLAYTMRTAREYYEAAGRVTTLTQPLLIFYGMTALSKAVFMTKHGKKSPSKGHGLRKVEGWKGTLAELSAEVTKDGTFPQFHGCYSGKDLDKLTFSVKDFLSLVPEVKVEFETVYHEKSKALKIQRRHNQVHVVDSELDQYGDLSELIFAIPGMHDVYIPEPVQLENKLVLFYSYVNLGAKDPSIRAISGDEYLVLPLSRSSERVCIPEMSVHFMLMYLLGMLSRYQPTEWGEIIGGEKTGEIYIIQKFLDTTVRKFPNLTLNELRDREFIFVGPKVETGREKRLDEEQLDQIYEYVNRKMAYAMRGF
jgi:hypothetical protein